MSPIILTQALAIKILRLSAGINRQNERASERQRISFRCTAAPCSVLIGVLIEFENAEFTLIDLFRLLQRLNRLFAHFLHPTTTTTGSIEAD
jgi:hypothetical protein